MRASYGDRNLCLAPGCPARTYEWIQRSADPRSNDTNTLGGEGERGGGKRIVKYLLKSMMVTLFLMLEGVGGNGMVERRKFV